MNNIPKQLEFAGAVPAPGSDDEPERKRWFADDPDMVVQCQPALAVYENDYGAVVIRMEARACDEDDPFIYVRPENLPALIAALKRHLSGGGSK